MPATLGGPQPRCEHGAAYGLIDAELHADFRRITRSSASAAAYSMAARLSPASRSGWFFNISASDCYAANMPSNRDTGNRNPLMQGLPSMICGLTVIRWSVMRCPLG